MYEYSIWVGRKSLIETSELHENICGFQYRIMISSDPTMPLKYTLIIHVKLY